MYFSFFPPLPIGPEEHKSYESVSKPINPPIPLFIDYMPTVSNITLLLKAIHTFFLINVNCYLLYINGLQITILGHLLIYGGLQQQQ